jgi:predicted RND superfamily exporter protein
MRYAEERASGKPVDSALHTTFIHATPGIVAAACATAVACYALMLADFRGIQELGFIAGSGILLSLLAALTLLPVLLVLTEPVTSYESMRAIKSGFVEGGLYATVAILAVTFLTLRVVRDTLLALFPVALGMLWTGGLMWLCDLRLNLANVMAVPLIIGIGIENGIHLVRRARTDRRDGWALVEGSTGQSVALFSLTSMVGFGSLMVARHYGMFSMGLLLALAIGSVLLASLTVLPLLLRAPVTTTARQRSQP